VGKMKVLFIGVCASKFMRFVNTAEDPL